MDSATENLNVMCVSPTQAIYLDAQAALDYLETRTDIDQSKLVAFGRSLGGAVAIQLASMPYYAQKLHGVIVENTFTSLPDIGRHIFDFRLISLLPEWCFKNKVSTVNQGYSNPVRISLTHFYNTYLSHIFISYKMCICKHF